MTEHKLGDPRREFCRNSALLQANRSCGDSRKVISSGEFESYYAALSNTNLQTSKQRRGY